MRREVCRGTFKGGAETSRRIMVTALHWDANARRLEIMSSRKMARLLPCVAMLLFAAVVPLLSVTARAQSAAATQAMAAQQQGKFAEAEKDWRAAVAENSQDAVAYANLGFVLAHQNKYGEAVPAYRKAAKLAPGMPG